MPTSRRWCATGGRRGACRRRSIPPAEMAALLTHLRSIERREPPLPRRTVRTTDGRTIEGELLGEGIRRPAAAHRRRARPPAAASSRRPRARASRPRSDWPTYNGEPGGNRHTTLRGIDKANVGAAGAALDGHAARCRRAPGHAGRRRRASCTSPRPTSASRSMPAAAAGCGTTSGRARRACRAGNANRGVGGGRRSRVHDDRPRAPDRARTASPARCCGTRRWPTGAQNYAASSAPLPAGDLVITGVARRRARRQRLRRRARSGHRQGSLALPDGAAAGRAGIGDVAGQGHRARRRADVVHRQLRPGSSTSSTGRPAIRRKEYDGDDRHGRQPVRVVHPRARPARPGGCAGTTSSRRTTSGTGTRRRPRCSSTPTGRASRAS